MVVHCRFSVLVGGFCIVVRDQVRVVRLLLVVNDHGLNIRQHVLALPKAPVFHLALLDAVHATIVNRSIATTSPILFVAASVPRPLTGHPSSAAAHLSMTGMYKLLNPLVMRI